MAGLSRVFMIFAALFTLTISVPSVAGGSHGDSACGSCHRSMHRPMATGVGRFPLRGFRAPVRRFFGLPGFTPVRQFLFGRGQIRRINRRAFLFG